MSDSLPVLVTGATGRLGTAVCEALVERGVSIRATDRRFAADFPVPVLLGDLLDEFFVHRVMEGCGAVVHLGNVPNPHAGPSAQGTLGDNTRMNANVFLSALDHGVRCLVFSSSIQVMLHQPGGYKDPPYDIPYLPLDGHAPRNPKKNTYALSKEFAERMLSLLCAEYPDLSATALRFPMLPPQHWIRHLESSPALPLRGLHFGECLASLQMPDAGALVAAVLAKRLTGYHQYFPAVATRIRGATTVDVIRHAYIGVPLKQPLESIDELIDVGEITRDLGWEPQRHIEVNVDRAPTSCLR